MATYRISEETPSPEKRLRYALFLPSFWLLGFSALDRVANGRWIPPTVLAGSGALFLLGTFLTNFLWPGKTPSYNLDIDDDGIRLRWNRKVVRTVRKDAVRYVREWGSGTYRKLVDSERGPVFTRCLWGGIGVPA